MINDKKIVTRAGGWMDKIPKKNIASICGVVFYRIDNELGFRIVIKTIR